MRIDIISIFPEYFMPLNVSVIGKAVRERLVDVRCHDLRSFAVDRHRTVDDAPFGGGPGMVMNAPVLGAAIDSIAASGPLDAVPTLILPTPSGQLFTQGWASDYAASEWLILACGRYEGIDARVVEHYRRSIDVDEVSIGDYVLAGGEAAALVILEATIRLLPGVLGNEASADADSFGRHGGGLLEGPVYTRPGEWRGLEVPSVLLSGDHQRIASWRARESVRRTREMRPDLLPGTDSNG